MLTKLKKAYIIMSIMNRALSNNYEIYTGRGIPIISLVFQNQFFGLYWHIFANNKVRHANYI